MMVRIRCNHCGQYSYVEDMGDNAVCSHCGRFILSIAKMLLEQAMGGRHAQTV